MRAKSGLASVCGENFSVRFSRKSYGFPDKANRAKALELLGTIYISLLILYTYCVMFFYNCMFHFGIILNSDCLRLTADVMQYPYLITSSPSKLIAFLSIVSYERRAYFPLRSYFIHVRNKLIVILEVKQK